MCKWKVIKDEPEMIECVIDPGVTATVEITTNWSGPCCSVEWLTFDTGDTWSVKPDLMDPGQDKIDWLPTVRFRYSVRKHLEFYYGSELEFKDIIEAKSESDTMARMLMSFPHGKGHQIFRQDVAELEKFSFAEIQQALMDTARKRKKQK